MDKKNHICEGTLLERLKAHADEYRGLDGQGMHVEPVKYRHAKMATLLEAIVEIERLEVIVKKLQGEENAS